MAKYESAPNYTVKYGEEKRKIIDFNPYGKYETNDKAEIAVLNGLCPKYVTCVEAEKPAQPKQQPASKPKPAQKSEKPAEESTKKADASDN